MRSVLFTLIFLFVNLITGYGQDTLFTRDSKKLNVKILEIDNNKEFVRYNLTGDQTFYIYNMPTNNVLKVVFKDGLIITRFKNKQSAENKEKKHKTYEEKEPQIVDTKNLISCNLVDLAFPNLTLTYERFVTKGHLGLKCPVSWGFNKTGKGGTRIENKTKSIGLDLNYYPTGQGAVRGFFGPAIEIGTFMYKAPPSEGIKNSEPEPLNVLYTCWYINAGVMINGEEKITCCFLLGVGGQYSREADFYNYSAVPETTKYPTWNLGISLGFRF